MIIEDIRRGITEMDRVKSIVRLCHQAPRNGLKPDGNAIARDVVDVLERHGQRLPEAARDVLRGAAAALLQLSGEQPK